MAKIKYYVEPSAFDRGFEKAVSFAYEWNAVLIDLGEVEPGKHQCYSLLDGHVNAQDKYLGQCEEITLENYREIAGGHIANTPEQYLYEGEVMSFAIDSLDEGEAIHVEFWDKLPGTFNKDAEQSDKLVLSYSEIEKLAKELKCATVEMMELSYGLGRVHLISKDIADKIDGYDADELSDIGELTDEEVEALLDDEIDLEL